MMTETPQIRVRKLTVEQMANGSFLTMDETGMTAEYPTAERVVRATKRRDAKAAERGESTATLIEWLDMPEGFTPPELGR